MTGLRTTLRAACSWRLATLAALIAGTAALHLVTDPGAHPLHDLYFKVTYVQIILGGLWYGKRGGLVVSLLTSLIYIWHTVYQLSPHGNPHGAAIQYEIVLYNVIAFLVGTLADRQAAQRRRLKEARDELSASLIKLQDQASTLLKAETELRESHRLRIAGQLAAEFAHEVRNPLGGILGATEILTRDQVDPAARREFSAVLNREVRRLDAVVATFLKLARRRGAEVEGIIFDETLRAVRGLLRRQLDGQGITLTVNDRTHGVTLAISPEHASQVFLNLLLNAIDALPRGGSVDATATCEDQNSRTRSS